MACDWVLTSWNYGVSGGPAISVGIYLSFPPANYALAQVALANADVNNGIMFSGISEYTVRPTPNGADQPVSFNWETDFGYPAGVWDNNMSSVSAEMEVGSEYGSGSFSLTIFFLS